MRVVTIKYPEVGDSFEEDEKVVVVSNEYRPAFNPGIAHRRVDARHNTLHSLSNLKWDEGNKTWRLK